MKKTKLLLLLAVTGCAQSGIIPAGIDTYMVSSSGVGYSSAGVRADVYAAANAFCEERGLVMVPMALSVKEGEAFRFPPSANLTFRALKPGDRAAVRPGDIERPN